MVQRNKNLLIGGLLAIILTMAVGYAAFATQLNINGTANITSTWDVQITNIEARDPVGTASNVDATVAPGGLSATFEAKVISPGDSVTYDVTVKNNGTLDAILSSIVFSQENTGDKIEGQELSETDPIVYTKANIEQGEKLTASSEKTFQITVAYNDSVTSQPASEQLKSALTMTLTYTQDND